MLVSDDSRQRLISVVVVAADSGPLLRTCLASVLTAEAALELILVDNASRDGEVERAQATHAADARFKCLRNQTNLGFGPACNRGARIAAGDVVIFLNPDCEWSAGTPAAIRAVLDHDPGIGLLGVCVVDAQGAPARGNRRRDPSLRRAVMSLSGLARWQQRWPALGGVEMPPASGEGIEYLEAVSGACMAMPRAVFDGVGGFDERYFLHVEDLDLCRRVREAGWRVAYAPELRVTHVQGSSSRSRPVFVARAKRRGMWRYFNRFDPAARNPLLRALVWCGLWGHFALRAAWLAVRSHATR